MSDKVDSKGNALNVGDFVTYDHRPTLYGKPMDTLMTRKGKIVGTVGQGFIVKHSSGRLSKFGHQLTKL